VRWTQPAHRNAGVPLPARREGTWEELKALLSTFRHTASKEAAGCWLPAEFLDPEEIDSTPVRVWEDGTPRRKAVNVKALHALVVDIDEGGRAALEPVLAKLDSNKVAYHWHTTFTSAEKFRLIVPLSRPVPASQWWDFWHWALKALGARQAADASCKDPSRLYYLPSTDVARSDEGATGGVDGRPIDVDSVLRLGPWPVAQRNVDTDAPPKAYAAATETELWAAERAIATIEAVDGQHGDTKTFLAAAMLRNDWALTAEEAWPILQRWNATHANPAWDEAGLREKFSNSGAYARHAYGSAREEKTAYQLEVERVAEELAGRLGPRVAKTAPSPWLWGDELLAMKFEQPDWAIQGLLPLETLTLIAGDPKASKTWALIDMALAVSAGGQALGEFDSMVPPGPCVLFLNEDSRRSVHNRLRALCAVHGYEPERAALVGIRARESLDLLDPAQVAELIVDVRLAGKSKPVLIGLDPLRNLHQGEENKSGDMARVMSACRAIRDLCHCAVVVVHHAAKRNGPDDQRRGSSLLRGSSAIAGAYDGLISLEDTEKSEDGCTIANTVTVELKAARGAGTFRLQLSIEDDAKGEATRATWARSDAEPKMAKKAGRTPKSSVNDAEEAILDIARRGEISRETLALEASRRDVGRDLAKACIKAMLADGRLLEGTPVPRGKPLVRAAISAVSRPASWVPDE
jgi:hypothetical protein